MTGLFLGLLLAALSDVLLFVWFTPILREQPLSSESQSNLEKRIGALVLLWTGSSWASASSPVQQAIHDLDAQLYMFGLFGLCGPVLGVLLLLYAKRFGRAFVAAWRAA